VILPFPKYTITGESFAYNQIRKMLGYVLHIVHRHVHASSLRLALDSPFKIHVPMTPGECLYLLGGTYLDRRHTLIDLFQFYPPSESSGSVTYPLFFFFFLFVSLFSFFSFCFISGLSFLSSFFLTPLPSSPLSLSHPSPI
jgi:hypothetical protein